MKIRSRFLINVKFRLRSDLDTNKCICIIESFHNNLYMISWIIDDIKYEGNYTFEFITNKFNIGEWIKI